jgi:hypothetical protein
VIEIERRGQDDLVAGIGHRENGGDEREVAACRHDDPARTADQDAVLPRELLLDGLDERREPFDRTVPVIGQRRSEAARRLQGFGRRPVRHDALPERDRPRRFSYPASDDRDDRCLNRGKPGRLEVKGAVLHDISIFGGWGFG